MAMPDASGFLGGIDWTQVSEVLALIICLTAVALLFIKLALPKYWEHKERIAEISKDTLSEGIVRNFETFEKKYAKDREEDKRERKARQEVFDARFNEIEKAVKINTLTSCAALMYTSGAPPLDIFNAAIPYFKLHGNGNGKERVAEVIKQAAPNRKIWQSALNEDMKKNGTCEDRYFMDVLSWIDKKLA